MLILINRAKTIKRSENRSPAHSTGPARVLPLRENRRATPLPTVTVSGVSDDWLRWHAIESGKRDGDD